MVDVGDLLVSIGTETHRTLLNLPSRIPLICTTRWLTNASRILMGKPVPFGSACQHSRHSRKQLVRLHALFEPLLFRAPKPLLQTPIPVWLLESVHPPKLQAFQSRQGAGTCTVAEPTHIRIVHIDPILEIVVGTALIGIEPSGSLLGLAHLFAIGCLQQRNGQCMCRLLALTTDQLHTTKNVEPLIIATQLQGATIFVVQDQKS